MKSTREIEKRVLAVLCMVVVSANLWAQKAKEMQTSYDFQRGVELVSAENPDYSEAEAAFLKELQVHPKNGYAYYYLSVINDMYDKEGSALDYATKAIKLLRKDEEWISYAYRIRAQIYLQLDKVEEAEADWNASLKENKDDYKTLYDRAEYYYQNNKYDLSNADYDRMLELQPNNLTGYLGKGRSLNKLKKWNEAIELLSYAIKLDPNESRPYSFRAEAYMGLKKYAEASDDIIKALSIDSDGMAFFLMQDFKSPEKDILLAKMRIQQAKEPNQVIWPYNQGVIYEQNGDYRMALEQYKKANVLLSNATVLQRLSNCYSELGDFDLALDYINRAEMMDSTDLTLLSDKGDILYDMGRAQDAIDCYSQFIAKNPEFFGGYYSRGFMKDNLRDVDGAIEDYTTAIMLDSTHVNCYLGRGDMYMLKGNKEAARADYLQAVARDTVYSDNNVAMYAYQALGEKDKAVAFMDSILAHSASSGNLYDAACLYSRLGEKEKALSYLEQSLKKGFRRFAHIRLDDDMDMIREMPEFKAMIEKYQKLAQQEQAPVAVGALDVTGKDGAKVSEVPFTREWGVCQVKCKINGLPLSFVFDTGASMVSLSNVEATFMMKNGYLKPSDVIGSAHFSDANGDVTEGTTLILRKVDFGDESLTNVHATVVRNQRAPLLLGQSVLSRLGKVEIDNQKGVIRFTK